jgi:hypothetical protein
MVGGVPVIRPIKAWEDAFNPLNRHVERIAWANITAEEALMRLRATLAGTSVPPSPPGGPHDLRLISVDVTAGSVVDVLNQVVHRHGEIMWSAVYETSPVRSGLQGLTIRFKWFDGHAITSEIPR